MRMHQQCRQTQFTLAQGSSSKLARTHQEARLSIHGIGFIFQGDAAELMNRIDWGLPELLGVEAFLLGVWSRGQLICRGKIGVRN